MTLSSPSAQAWVTIWHMHPTMAAVEALSAPPDRGNRYPAAPAGAALRDHIYTSFRTQPSRGKLVALMQTALWQIKSSLLFKSASPCMACKNAVAHV